MPCDKYGKGMHKGKKGDGAHMGEEMMKKKGKAKKGKGKK